MTDVIRTHASTLPAARSILYPGIGHTPFWENPPAFDRDLAEFLRYFAP